MAVIAHVLPPSFVRPRKISQCLSPSASLTSGVPVLGSAFVEKYTVEVSRGSRQISPV